MSSRDAVVAGCKSFCTPLLPFCAAGGMHLSLSMHCSCYGPPSAPLLLSSPLQLLGPIIATLVMVVLKVEGVPGAEAVSWRAALAPLEAMLLFYFLIVLCAMAFATVMKCKERRRNRRTKTDPFMLGGRDALAWVDFGEEW